MEIKTIKAGSLEVAYLVAGPSDGWPCVLCHGFPYDPHAFAEAAPRLATAGARVIIPYLRGYGPTRFLSRDSLRSGEQAHSLAISWRCSMRSG
jgi:pimeloyl-ACP methyl ester carboxylesterase